MKSICNICKHDDARLIFYTKDNRYNPKNNKKFRLIQCLNCGLVYINPLPDDSAIKDSYGFNYFKLKDGSKPKGRIIQILKFIKKKFSLNIYPTYKFYRLKNKFFSNNSGKFLDVGCATGLLDEFLIKEFPRWKFFGIEPSEGAFKRASRVNEFKVFKGALEDAKYPSDYFDIILINQVLEHVYDPASVINKCSHILKSTGKLIIAVPDFNSFSSKIFGKYWYHLDVPRHLYHFNIKSLELILERNGFLIQKKEKESLPGSFVKSIFLLFGSNPDSLDSSYAWVAVKILFNPILNFLNILFEKFGISNGIFIIAIKN